MFSINNENVRKLERDLKQMAERALPFATKKTLNDAAFQAQRIIKADLPKDFILKNRFTMRSIRVEQARTLNIRRQQSVIGSTAAFMEDQEFGGIIRSKGKHGVPIPTSFSAGQGEKTKPRTRLPRKANRLRNLRLSKRNKTAASKKQRNMITIRNAIDTGNRVVFLDLQHSKGIFKITGRKKLRFKMLYNLTHKSLVIPKRPWLKPAFDESIRMIPAFYADALRFQLKRHRLFT